MNTGSKAYQNYVKSHAKKSPLGKDVLWAFLIGGTICALAESLFHLYLLFSIPEETVKTLVPVTLIFLAGLLTGLGVFDDIAADFHFRPQGEFPQRFARFRRRVRYGNRLGTTHCGDELFL